MEDERRASVASTSTQSSLSPSLASLSEHEVVLIRRPTSQGGPSGAQPTRQQLSTTAAHWARKEQASLVDLSHLVQGMRKQKARQDSLETETELLRTQADGLMLGERSEKVEGARAAQKDTQELPRQSPSDAKAEMKRKPGHSRIRSLFSSSSSKPTIKASISSPIISVPSPPSSDPPAPQQGRLGGHSHSASTPQAVAPPSRSQSSSNVKLDTSTTASHPRPISPTQSNKLIRRPSLLSLRKRADGGAITQEAKGGWFSGGKSKLRRSPSSTALAAASREAAAIPPPPVPSIPSARSRSPTSSLRPVVSRQSTLTERDDDLTARVTKEKRRPSIPESALKVLTSFALSRTSSNTGSSSSMELSDEELRSWKLGAKGKAEREKDRELELLRKRASDELETMVQRGPRVREDHALVDAVQKFSRGSSHSVSLSSTPPRSLMTDCITQTSPERARDITPDIDSRDSTPRAARIRLPVTAESPMKRRSSTPTPTAAPHISDSLPEELAVSFLAASGYLEQTVPAPPLPLPSAIPPTTSTARATPRPKRTSSLRHPTAVATSSSSPSSLAHSHSFPLGSGSSTPLLGGLQPPPRASPKRVAASSPSTGDLSPASTAGRRIISSQAWTQVSLSANPGGRRSSAAREGSRRGDKNGGSAEGGTVEQKDAKDDGMDATSSSTSSPPSTFDAPPPPPPPPPSSRPITPPPSPPDEQLAA